MNSFKMAFRNIRKSSKDYSVYFFTLIIGVAVFYMFNSIGSQQFMATIITSSNDGLKTFVRVIEVISVGVAFVLGLLMVYANNFLIKRRKSEFGVYLMLGMSRKKVAGILSLETLMVGILSLAAGLLTGVLGSQFLSVIVGKMFEADLSSYSFTFSMGVLLKTTVYFMVIFLVVLIFNAKVFSKYELIELLSAGKRAEKQLIKNTKVSVALFALAVILLVFAYAQIGFNGQNQSRGEFVGAVITGFLGNFLFFFSLAGFLPALLKKFKGFYMDKLNAFVTKQFGHNINSSAASFSIISILLFLAICAFSVGFSMNGYLNNRMKNSTPVDASAESLEGRVSSRLAQNGYNVDALMDEYVEVPIYYSDYVLTGSPLNMSMDEASEVFRLAKWDSNENVVRLSDYNKLEALYGRKALSLKNDEYAVVCDFDILKELIDTAIDRGNVIPVGDVNLKSGYKTCISEYVLMSDMTAMMGVIVFPDAVIDAYSDDFEEIGSVFAGNYSGSDVAGGDAVFKKLFSESEEGDAITQYSTRTEIKSKNVNTSVSVVFVVLYIGIVFIITGAAVIALKILSDSMDAVEKYGILMRVGADEKMRKNALFVQTLLNFALPLALGLIHSIFALRYAKGLLRAVGMNGMFGGTVSAVLVMLLVYGGYFFITYEACKKNVIGSNI